MDKKKYNDNNLFDEVDDEEEIKEDIVIEDNNDDNNNEGNKNQNFINTYDKFLIESAAIDNGDNCNEYHYLLKNQMINIIDDIKKKENEEQENKNNIKKRIFKDMENLFIKKYNNNNEDDILKENKNEKEKEINNQYDLKEEKEIKNNKNKKKININQYTLNPNQYNNNQNNNNYMENLRDLDDTNNQANNNNNNLNDNTDIDNDNNNNYLKESEEKDKTIDLNTKKDRGYLNNNNSNEVTESKEYNINIDDFLKENTINDEDMVNNATNIDYSDNNNYNNINKNNMDKNIKYAVMGNPQLKQKINENYDYFSQKNKNSIPINQQLTAKFNSLANRENYYKNNNEENYENQKNFDKKSEMIYIDDCKTEEERKAQQKKFEEKKQKKLKELEEKIRHKRAQSKPKPTNNNNNNEIKSSNNNIINDRQGNFNSNTKPKNNKPIILRPRTSKSKPMTYINNHNKNTHVAISAINKEESQMVDNSEYNYSNNNVVNTKIKKPLRPMSTKSNNISRFSKNNNTTLMSNNTSHYSTLSRVPIRIEREESKLANKKVKNVHYSKMSNKKVIKKAINEVCLAGNTNKEYRDKINDIIDKCEYENYIILFRGNYGRFDIKAIYTYDIQNKNIEILTCIGNAPNFIDSSMVATFYKYNISANQFKELRGTKEFSCIVDAVCLRK